jgi:hypothetical protein
MEQYVRFWRYLPRFVVGACFLLLCLANFVDKAYVIELWKIFATPQNESLQGIFSTAVFAVLVTAACAVGLYILEICVVAVGIAFSRLCTISVFEQLVDFIGLMDVVVENNHLARLLYVRHNENISNFYRLRSLSVPQMLEKKQIVDAHWKDVQEFLLDLDERYPLSELAYYSALTQEQVTLKRMQDDVSDIYNSCIVIFVLCATYIHLSGATQASILISLALMFVLFLLLFVARDRKRKLAFYILFAFTDNFTNADFANIEDRESF